MGADMIEGLVLPLTFVAAVGTGLMAGFFLAFSACVMKALARLAPMQGIAAMQSINVSVLNPVFLTTFFGTALVCAVLTILSVLDWHRPGSSLQFTGGLLYLFGSILVTILCNVPRNERLARVDPASVEGARLWTVYVTEWTAWNHVRTLASLASAAAFVLVLRN
jgi:uncharacterized membrane protein